MDMNGKKSSVLFQVKKDLALGIRSNLEAISGKTVEVGIAQK